MKKITLIILSLLYAVKGFSQSSPSPIYVISGDADVEFAPYNEGTYPTGFIGWNGPNVEVAPTSSIPKNVQAKGDAPLVPIASAGSTTHWSSIAFNNEGDGISWRANTSDNTPMALCMALNTRGCHGMKVKFTWGCKTNYANGGKAAICFQYRIGNSGDWSNDSEASDARFSSIKTAQLKETKTVTLPATCDDKELVQVRWLVVRETASAVGSADRMHVNAISYSATTRDPQISPVAGFSFTNDTTTVSFIDESTNLPTSYLWDFGDSIGTSTLQNPVYEYAAFGDYNVTLIVSNSAGSDTISKFIHVGLPESNTAPNAMDDEALCDYDSSVTIDVLANDQDMENNLNPNSLVVVSMPANGSSVISQENKIAYTPNSGFAGTDSLKYSICDYGVPALCDTAAVRIDVLFVDGVHAISTPHPIQLFPNPSETTLRIKNTELIDQLEIYTTLGKRVMVISNVNSTSMAVNTQNLPKGSYVIRITSGNSTFSGAFFKL